MKIISVASARPNFTKIVAIINAFWIVPTIESVHVHIGQHYYEHMNICSSATFASHNRS